MVFDNKAGFIKLRSFHFPILTLSLNPWTNVSVGSPWFVLHWLFPYQISKEQSHSASHGIQEPQGCLKPEILCRGQEEDGPSFVQGQLGIQAALSCQCWDLMGALLWAGQAPV